MTKIIYCSKCLIMSTRPRIKFNKDGVCSACQWNEEKQKLDWKKRRNLLKNICNKQKNKKNFYDCIVPVSGGKDGSYVTHQLKTKYKMNPLTATVRPALEMELGKKNLDSFIETGVAHLHVSPDKEAMRKLNLYGYEKLGFPYYGWLIAIHTVILRIASMLNIELIFYAEDGEVEYGGSHKYKDKGIYDIEYIKKNYLEAGYDKALLNAGLNKNESYWFKLPDFKEFKKNKIKLTHYSFYENWDPYRNYLVAKKFFGLEESKSLNEGSYTNFAQNDQKLYALHTYIMYLKYGFGRCNQDASIDIRRGSLNRDQAVELVKLYDGKEPTDFYDEYCEYFKINKKKFLQIRDKWVNKKLFVKKVKKWLPKFQVL